MIFDDSFEINKKRKRQNHLSKPLEGVICPILEKLGCGIPGFIGWRVK